MIILLFAIYSRQLTSVLAGVEYYLSYHTLVFFNKYVLLGSCKLIVVNRAFECV